jgi:hypothetical protein
MNSCQNNVTRVTFYNKRVTINFCKEILYTKYIKSMVNNYNGGQHGRQLCIAQIKRNKYINNNNKENKVI